MPPTPLGPPKRPLKVLFFMANLSGFFRNFEPVIRMLLDRGHHVHLALERVERGPGEKWARDLGLEYPGLTYSLTPGLRYDIWYPLMRDVRLMLDYIEALDPRFHAAPALVARARSRAEREVAGFVRAVDRAMAQRPEVLRAVAQALEHVERAIPASEDLNRYIRMHAPDVILLTPHLNPGSTHTWSLRSAQATGVPSMVCIASWDNLSSKQLLRGESDVVTVWNDVQREEAMELHGVPPERIVVTGAQLYDQWFDWQPRPREEFCERVGLPPDKPYVLYLGGALFPAEITEADWAMQWIRKLSRTQRSGLTDISILVRSHPKRVDEWDIKLLKRRGVAFWPRADTMPVAEEAKADLFDSLFHSAAVVGLNTSAMIEAGIVGKRVHTVLVPEFAGSQNGVFHFRYLTDVGGGLLRVAGGLSEHVRQLAQTMREQSASANGANPNAAFLEKFVRPHGLDQPATPIFVDTVERLADRPARPAPRPTPLQRAARPVLEAIDHQLALTALRRRSRRRGEAKPPPRAVLPPLGELLRDPGAFAAGQRRRILDLQSNRERRLRAVPED